MRSSQICGWLFLNFFLAGCAEDAVGVKGEDAPASAPPNIVFIMADDHAFQAIGAYGSTRNETPNIDRLATAGMRFDRGYVTNSICAPSRAVVLAGKHSHLNGVRHNRNVFDGSQQTFPKLLQANGYQTAIVGKWHLKSDPTGFDFWRILQGQGSYYRPEFRTPDGTLTLPGYVTDRITDTAIDWLDSGRDKDKPFLLMVQTKAPHREWMPAPRHLPDVGDNDIAEPDSLLDDYGGRGTAARVAEMRISDHMGLTSDNKIDPELASSLGYEDFSARYAGAYTRNRARLSEAEKRDWDAAYGPINERFADIRPEGPALTRWKYQRYMQDYLATIDAVDENVGRLLDYLDEQGLVENTVVIYTSDQGFYLGEHGWFDKRFMYEESFRTPPIVRWPARVAAGSVNTSLVQNLDFAPTLLQAAGVTVPDDMQGQSLMRLLAGETDAFRDALYYHYYEYPGVHAVKRHYGVATARYKLMHFYYDIDEWELYDLEADPQELRNVYGMPQYAEVQARLENRLEELREQFGDSEALDKSFLESDLAVAR